MPVLFQKTVAEWEEIWILGTSYCVGVNTMAVVNTRAEAVAWFSRLGGELIRDEDELIAFDLTVPGCVRSEGYARRLYRNLSVVEAT